MEQNKNIEKNIDAIIIPSGGTVMGKDGKYHSTSYNDGDAFGTLGGYARVEAGAILARRYSKAVLIVSRVMKEELVDFGVDRDRIICEEVSTNTKSGMEQDLVLTNRNNWKTVIFVTNEYHIPRVSTIWEMLNSSVQAYFMSAEKIIIEVRPEFEETFTQIKKTEAYQKRLASEAKGIEALHSGKYKSAGIEDKRERSV